MLNKFRAWDSRNNEMVFSDETPCFYINTQGVLFMYGIPKKEGGGYHKSYDVDNFTGLQDKNGVDIYESDILINDLGRVCEVKWHEHQAGFDCEFIKDTRYQKDTDMTLGFRNVHLHIFTEVIGNKFESPELLEQ
ncbi:MAG TPA: hypothetical protein EYN67_04930 [Flavobacteriales bacterium]|nr:hypothetical protein [Methylococcaceae bacterium]HHZ94902.1 hypothetical protein [Flavobacteriales bacterium]